jgi:hypothetical protein
LRGGGYSPGGHGQGSCGQSKGFFHFHLLVVE